MQGEGRRGLPLRHGPPDRIEEHATRCLAEEPGAGTRDAALLAPGFFGRKRAEDDLRLANEVLRQKYQTSAQDLAQANRELRKALTELEILKESALDANPLTGLPGGTTIERRVQQALSAREPLVVIYADLDHFKAYNDSYGYQSGNAVISFTARTLLRIVLLDDQATRDGHFVGHIGGDDFLVLVRREHLDALTTRILRTFDQGIRAFFRAEDVGRGWIMTHDRRGDPRQIPITSLSLAGVDLSLGTYDQAFQVSEACAEVKRLAKVQEGSCFFLDRRGPSPAARP